MKYSCKWARIKEFQAERKQGSKEVANTSGPKELIELSDKKCLISNSMKSKVIVRTEILYDDKKIS